MLDYVFDFLLDHSADPGRVILYHYHCCKEPLHRPPLVSYSTRICAGITGW